MSILPAPPILDVLGRPGPWWLSHLFQDSPAAADSAGVATTAAQHLKLGAWMTGDVSGTVIKLWRNDLLAASCLPLEEAEATLTHGRQLRRVSETRGDVDLHVDFADFLSCEGVALTKATTEVQLLTARTLQRAYTSPFWLTQGQMGQCWSEIANWKLRRAASTTVLPLREKFHDSDIFVELGGGDEGGERYVNVDEVTATRGTSALLRRCLSLFRVFTPISVRTRRPFDARVALRLRAECFHSGCWCSVWGTEEDYASSGFAALEGAIGVHVVDTLGNPLFLIHALCTTAPLDVLVSCYPNESLLISGTV
ncbi:hypothetical protein NESM_000072500 [Novymonas esmeraldas]|uniref:Trypanosoma Tc-38 (p38) protein domain-containing protein n=1 Tax=Novymonas esmeraldas TaxID=1808958 RepID=A0AAW0F3K5_9TRYP